MSPSPTVKKLIDSLERTDISATDRSLLITATLTKLAAIPLRDIITADEKGNLFISGRKLDPEEANQLRGSAMRVLQSKAFKLIQEQVVYTTFVYAAHTAATPEQLMFGKAALWWGQQEDKYLKLLSYEDRHGNLPSLEE